MLTRRVSSADFLYARIMALYDDALAQYIRDRFAAEDAALRVARDESERAGLPAISIKPDEGRFLQILARAVGARQAVEIGTLGGYSAIWIARGLAPGGRLVTIDANPKHAEVAGANLARAGLGASANRGDAGRAGGSGAAAPAFVEVRVGDAHEMLRALALEGPFDFCFIDAEKTGYGAYLDWALANVREGGAIAAHNAFRGGDLLDPSKTDADTEAIRAINERFAREPRLTSSICPGGDGTVFGIVLR